MSSSPGRGRPGRSPGTSKSWKTSPRTWPASAAFARDLELELTADYLVKQDEERERIHAERERQKEEEAACRDFEREKTRPMKEQAHYSMALARLHELGDSTAAAEIQEHLDQVTQSIAYVDRRVANIRAGDVYIISNIIISNIGSFGGTWSRSA
jgi:hypothetical protein